MRYMKYGIVLGAWLIGSGAYGLTPEIEALIKSKVEAKAAELRSFAKNQVIDDIDRLKNELASAQGLLDTLQTQYPSVLY